MTWFTFSTVKDAPDKAEYDAVLFKAKMMGSFLSLGVPPTYSFLLLNLTHLHNLRNLLHLSPVGVGLPPVSFFAPAGGVWRARSFRRSLLHTTPPKPMRKKDVGVRPHADYLKKQKPFSK